MSCDRLAGRVAALGSALTENLEESDAEIGTRVNPLTANMTRSQAKTAQKTWVRSVLRELGLRALLSFKLPSVVPFCGSAPMLFPASCCWRVFHACSKCSSSVPGFMPPVRGALVLNEERYLLVIVNDCRNMLDRFILKAHSVKVFSYGIGERYKCRGRHSVMPMQGTKGKTPLFSLARQRK